MKKCLLLFLLVLSLIFTCLITASCKSTDPQETGETADDPQKEDSSADPDPDPDPDPAPDPEVTKYRVVVAAGDHITVKGETSLSVPEGEDAVFELEVDDGYMITGVTAGTYENGKLTLKNVTSKAYITVTASQVTSSDTYFISANGGTVNSDSRNVKATSYYTASASANGVTLKLSADVLTKVGCLSTFWDDGTFTREGYVLKEYNTKADGSGEGYSLGSKFYGQKIGDTYPTLYCIWEEAKPSDFTYADYMYSRPVDQSKAPDWQENGVIITGYTGSDATVTIPETLGGKPVIAIDTGAFDGVSSMKTLVFSRYLLEVKSGAFTGCSSLETLYFNDSIYSIPNDAFDDSTYGKLKNFYVNATMAPRYSNTGEGAFAYKLAKLLSTEKENRVIVIAGSSSYQGLATDYLEALLGDYTVINFGTTRTTHGSVYLEAMQKYAHEGDIVLYAPENSIYMLGESELYWKTLRDLENINNFYRYIDISNYTNVFGAFTDFNQNYRYSRAPLTYEQITKVNNITEDGDYYNTNREVYCNDAKYSDAYFITLNSRVKSKDEGQWNDVAAQTRNKDYTDLTNITWATFTDEKYTSLMNHAFDCAKSSGASVYFSFCPVDGSKLVTGAATQAWLTAYDSLIASSYHVDGILGTSKDYIFDHSYFYDCAFHPNDYGRTWRTYQVYEDLCTLLKRDAVDYDSQGTSFQGCKFEKNANNSPLTAFDIQ